jgi:hypothetical protein
MTTPSKAKGCITCGGARPLGATKYCAPCRVRATVARAKVNSAKDAANKKEARRVRGPIERKPRPRRGPVDGVLLCNRCGSILPIKSFKKNHKGSYTYCKLCVSEYGYEHRLRSVYGITLNNYKMLLAEQDGKCAICLITPKKRRLAVDHNHATGQVRGLLCTICNHRLLGGSKENAAILRRAADYLENPPGQHHGFRMEI